MKVSPQWQFSEGQFSQRRFQDFLIYLTKAALIIFKLSLFDFSTIFLQENVNKTLISFFIIERLKRLFITITLFMKQQYTSVGSEIIEILVKSSIETTGVNKLFLTFFERTYDGLYMRQFLQMQHAPVKRNDAGLNYFALPQL